MNLEQSAKDKDNIQVIVRVRPLNEKEKREDAKLCIIMKEPQTIILDTNPEQKTFNYDSVVGINSTQEQVFQIVGRPLTHSCLEGYNGCIFAYGQTGAGKTYTMQGKGFEESNSSQEHRGLQPRVFDFLFAMTQKQIEEQQASEYLIKCTYLEIYNEQINDLLNQQAGSLQIREDFKKGVYVEGLTEECASTSEEAIELLRRGANNRHVGSTNMNIESSRSHSVFTMTVESRVCNGGVSTVKSSKIHFVDLAGSERQKLTAAAGERLKEASNINKSLTVLGCVINSLVEISEGKQRHIRYRDSKLSFLLKDSLGGNSKTFMIANISPASSSFQETLSTLKFAQRAKMIKNKASINEESMGNIEGLKSEIRKLKDELNKAQNLISTLELHKKNLSKASPYMTITSQSDQNSQEIHSNIEIQQKYIYEFNKKVLEIENGFKEAVQDFKQTQVSLNDEINKKEENIKSVKRICNFYEETETQLRATINQYEERINKLMQAQQQKLTLDQQKLLFNNDYELIKKQVQHLQQTIQKTGPVMKTYNENILLKEKLEALESVYNTENQTSVLSQLQDNMISIQNLTAKIEDDMKERQFLLEKMEEYGFISNEQTYKNKKTEEEIHQLKNEYNHKIEELTNQIFDLQKKETQITLDLQEEKRKGQFLQNNVSEVSKNKEYEKDHYEKRIQDLIRSFQEITENNMTDNELENAVALLNVKLLETNQKYHTMRLKNDQLLKKLNDAQNSLTNEIKEKDLVMRRFTNQFENIRREKTILENTLKNTENNLKDTLNELNSSKESSALLNNKFSELFNDLENARNNLEIQLSDNLFLKKQIDTLISEPAINKLKMTIDKLENKCESLENDKKRLIEEQEILSQTYEFRMQEFDEKKKILESIQKKMKDKGIDISDIEKIQNKLSPNTADKNKKSSSTNKVQLQEVMILKQQLEEKEKQENQLKQKLQQLQENEYNLKQQLFQSNYNIKQLQKQSNNKIEEEPNPEEKQQIPNKNIKDDVTSKIKELTQQVNKLKEDINLQKNKYELTIKNLNEQHDKILVQNQEQLTQKLQEWYTQKNELQNEFNGKLEQYKHKLQTQNEKLNQYKQLIEEQKNKLEIKYKNDLSTQKDIYDSQLKNLEENYKNQKYQKGINNVEQNEKQWQIKFDELQQKYQIELASKESDYQKKIMDLDKKYEQEKSKLKANQLQEIKNIEYKHQEELQYIKNDYQNTINNLKNTAKQQISEANQEKDIELKDIQLEYNDKIKNINEDYAYQIQQIKTDHQYEMNKKIGDYQAKIDELQHKYNEQFDLVDNQLKCENNLNQQQEQEIYSMKKQIQVLNDKCYELEKSNLEKSNQISVYLQKLDVLEMQTNYTQDGYQLHVNFKQLKDENQTLRDELINKNHTIEQQHLSIKELINEQETQLKIYNEQFLNLQQHQAFILEVTQIKEEELISLQEEYKLVVLEKDKLSEELCLLKDLHQQVTTQTNNYEEQINVLQNQNNQLTQEASTLKEANKSYIANENVDSKFKNLNKIQEELKQIKEEKQKLVTQNQYLSRRIDELLRKNQQGSRGIQEELKDMNQLKQQIEKQQKDIKEYADLINNMSSLLNVQLKKSSPRISQDKQVKTSNINTTNNEDDVISGNNQILFNAVKLLVNQHKEKIEEVKKKQHQCEAIQLKANVSEKDLKVLQQKLSLIYQANPALNLNPQSILHSSNNNIQQKNIQQEQLVDRTYNIVNTESNQTINSNLIKKRGSQDEMTTNETLIKKKLKK